MAVKALAAAAALLVPILVAAQQQSANPRSGWPCGARLDQSYFHLAEATGGHLLLLAPEEIADSAALLTAFTPHPQTIFRLAGSLTPGDHEFQVPIDSSVESAIFSISVQCLQGAQILRPSGSPVTGDDVTDLSNFRAQRMVIVAKPEPGMWTIRTSGSGLAAVVVQARTEMAISQVQFAPAAGAAFTAVPATGVENLVSIQMTGKLAEITAATVTGGLRRIADLPLEPGETPGSYVSRFTPGAQAFRILVEGKDANGVAVQRLHAPLFTPER
jgi:hypothetical protein